ncbi:uncharacterized protein N7469_006450 [Penicillium citrinum]|uniref:Exonuclease domain-containing protein n=1 Tax=Penicillium citrinum TaxID=5077 RepID=A0A9W9TML4_PENCI|nr:uncharacterized protein N7469_006450 [Penicillium citrinum]KAJ5231862.1 hypothetical protein N7469_006450 [Penicillium citrinum]
MKLEQYYEHGAYAAAMAKPKVEVKRTEQNRRSIIPIQHDTPLLGVHMDRNRPCYVINDTYYNMDLMQWWSHMVPVRWSEYFEKHRGHTTVPKAKCIGHPGDVTGRGWTCCNRPIHSKGCYEDLYHSIPEIDMTEMTKEWELFRTPASALNPHAAVALCCETGVTKTGDPELVRVSMIDFFTGKILINSVVFPKADMLHLNTRWSGVAWSMLYHARKTHTILEGRDHARREVWKFVGPETMVIVHSGGRKALEELRWIHKQVIDTEELESRRKKREQVPDMWKAGLRKLARAHLKRDIENSTFGHDTVESAIACRDLVLWYLENLPEIMKTKIDSSPRAPPNDDEEFWGQLCEAARDNRYVLARNYQVENGEDDNHREESSEEPESE